KDINASRGWSAPARVCRRARVERCAPWPCSSWRGRLARADSLHAGRMPTPRVVAGYLLTSLSSRILPDEEFIRINQLIGPHVPLRDEPDLPLGVGQHQIAFGRFRRVVNSQHFVNQLWIE